MPLCKPKLLPGLYVSGLPRGAERPLPDAQRTAWSEKWAGGPAVEAVKCILTAIRRPKTEIPVQTGK